MQINATKSFLPILAVVIVMAIYLVCMGYSSALPSLFGNAVLIYGGFHFLSWLRAKKLNNNKK